MADQEHTRIVPPDGADAATAEARVDDVGENDDTGGAPAESPEELRLMLEDARNRADEHWDGLLRARAELENLRRRSARELESAHKFGVERLITELLPVWDSMELGLDAASEDGADVEKVREGIELTLRMLATAMQKVGVEQVDPLGEKFDPELHQAVTMQASEDAEPGSVVNVIQRGYTLSGRLVRPAMVVVAREPEANS